MTFSKGGKREWALLLLMSIPVVVYFMFFFKMAVNVPFGDDYPVLNFLVNFTNPDFPDKFELLFSQHNEHRIVTLRLVLLIIYYLGLKINFVHIAFLGNLGLLGIVFLLFKGFTSKEKEHSSPLKEVKNRFFYFVPVLFLLFQPQHHQLTVWAMAAFTNIFVVFFSFLTLYLLLCSRSSLSFPGAILFLGLASYTNGNGTFVFFIGIIALILEKKIKRLVIWLFAGSIYIGFYFYSFTTNPALHDIISYLKNNFLNAVEYFLSVLGSFSDFGVFRPYLTILTGLVILSGLLFLIKKKLYRRDLFLFSGIIFVVLSIAAQAWVRSVLGVAQSFTSRYKFISALLLVLLYLSILRLVKEKKKVLTAFFVFSLMFSVVSYYRNYPKARDFQTVFVRDLNEWNAGHNTLAYVNPEHAEITMRLAVKRKIYEPPYGIIRPNFPFGQIILADDISTENTHEIVFTGWALDDGGTPKILVRRGSITSEGKPLSQHDGFTYLGQAVYKKGTIPSIAMMYYGFPSMDRMIWEFRFKPDKNRPAEEQTALFFFARDRVGNETLLGQRSIL